MADTSTDPAIIPSGQPPLFTITPTDQAGTIVIVTGICIVIAIVSILVRACVLLISGRNRLNRDDWAIVVAALFAIIQTSLVQKEAHGGLGRTLADVTGDELRQIQKTQYADQIFYILSIWTTKLSMTLFFHHLSPRRSDRTISVGAVALVALTAIVAILTISLVCDLSSPWQYFTSTGISCTAPFRRWVVVAIMDIATEVVLAVIALRIVWCLQVQSTKKIVLSFVFLQRLAIIGPILSHLHYLSRVYHSDDPTLLATFSTICKEVEVAFAIVAACVPYFRPFLHATATNYGAPPPGSRAGYVQYAEPGKVSKHSGNSFSLRSLRPKQRDQPQPSLADESQIQENRLAPPKKRFSVGGDGRRVKDAESIESDDSKRMIIRKEIQYSVQYCDDPTTDQSHQA